MFKNYEVDTKDEMYKSIENKHQLFLGEFKRYAENQTIEAGNAKNGKSAKASSYYRYLIRLVVGMERQLDEIVDNLRDEHVAEKLEQISSNPEFIEFNRKKKYFYSATISCYKSFLKHLALLQEEKLDSEINLISDGIEGEMNNTEVIQNSRDKKEKILSNNIKVYPRSAYEVRLSKEISKWKCEIDPEHETFTNLSNNKPYMEAHHLIPMSKQDDFVKSIDFAENIICLCPNCHRKIHYAIPEIKGQMIFELFEKRKEKYPLYGIGIDLGKLYKYYSI
ncbi:hypothetical protein HED34_11540 [Vagococcus fluvialis]|uniref:HNH endonuclease n=1 Tax=Vagococcus fluvialis TaxID=2738 RepID=UPI0014332980|nr:HNH endonuclease [Vagococcus fluvialis]NKC60592.1 hypothetical protein [Vagococcus fluvialis]NKD51424.1 hypothetical protein [Vagococcus fluvialis]